MMVHLKILPMSDSGEGSPSTDPDIQTGETNDVKPVNSKNPVLKPKRKRKPKNKTSEQACSSRSFSGDKIPAEFQTPLTRQHSSERETNKKPAKIQTPLSRDTLSGQEPHPDYVKKGPLITEDMFNKWSPDLLGLPGRPQRTTRNPNPQYTD